MLLPEQVKPSLKALRNEQGFTFDAFSGLAPLFNGNSKYRDFGLACHLIYGPDEDPIEYCLSQNGSAVYGHPSIESVCIYADLLILVEQKQE